MVLMPITAYADFFTEANRQYANNHKQLSLALTYHQAVQYQCNKEPTIQAYFLFQKTETYRLMLDKANKHQPLGVFTIEKMLVKANEKEKFCKG